MIIIETDSVVDDCDTCGTNFSDGGSIVIDDKEIFNYPAIASCFHFGYNTEALLIRALLEFTDTVSIDGSVYTLEDFNNE